MLEIQKRWWLDFVETLKTIFDTNNLDKMWVYLGTNLPRKTRESSLKTVQRCISKIRKMLRD